MGNTVISHDCVSAFNNSATKHESGSKPNGDVIQTSNAVTTVV